MRKVYEKKCAGFKNICRTQNAHLSHKRWTTEFSCKHFRFVLVCLLRLHFRWITITIVQRQRCTTTTNNKQQLLQMVFNDILCFYKCYGRIEYRLNLERSRPWGCLCYSHSLCFFFKNKRFYVNVQWNFTIFLPLMGDFSSILPSIFRPWW